MNHVSVSLADRMARWRAVGACAAPIAWSFLCGARMPEPALGQAAMPFRLFLVGLILINTLATVTLAPQAGLLGVVLAIPYLGFLRRALIPVAGYIGTDPITLLPVLAGALLFGRLVLRRAIRLDTPIAKLILPLMAVMAFQILNPRQGGIAVGLGGAVFFFGPLFWFFVGRATVTRAMLPGMLRAVQVGALICGAYGLFQTFNGFHEVERLWIQESRYSQLIGGTYRVFSTFLSFGEYAGFLVMGCVVSFAQVIQRRVVQLPLFLFLAVMVALSSSRGALFSACFGGAVVWAIAGANPRVWVPRFVVAAALGIAAVVSGVQTANEFASTEPTRVSLEHQVEGLTQPFREGATGQFHRDLVLGGIASGFRNPLGNGLGSTTIAARKFSENEMTSSEFDIGDMFLGSGLVGGLLYVGVVFMVARTLARDWRRTRDPSIRTIAGLLAALFGSWLSGGYYSLSVIIWLFIGALDRMSGEPAVAPSPTPEGGAPAARSARTA